MRTIRRQVDSETLDEFVIETDESAPDFIVTAFVDWLAEYVASGVTFNNGQTLQYGFTLLTCLVKSRMLRLTAPDFQSLPINWIVNLGPAFHVIAAHKYVPETFGLVPDIPCLLNTAIVGSRFDEFPMFVARMPPIESNPNDSGWFIGSSRDDVDNNDPKQLRLMSLYEAILAVPHVLDFLSLPVDCQVVFPGDVPTVLRNYEELEIPQGSYLDLRLRG